jgi:hypothetical protein
MKKRTIKKKPSLVRADINEILHCTNKKHGCNLRAKQFTCYNRVSYNRNKSSADKITFTNKRNKTKKIKPAVLRVGHVWYNCSRFRK